VKNSERGSSLVEGLVAMLLLGIVLTGIIPSFLSFLDANSRNELRTGAAQAAQIELETLRKVQASTLPSSGSSSPSTVEVGDRAFNVVTHYCRAAQWCDSVSRHLRLEVSYDGDLLYSTETVYTELR
jgi:type II secretory pathway pseudopilin PulG